MIRKPSFMRIGSALLLTAALSTLATPSFAFGYGTGSCLVWQSIKSVMTGVHCSYL